MEILVAAVSLFIFLFFFHFFSKDDYFFIRRGVMMEQLFNILFIGFFWGVIISRITYILLHPEKNLFNPLAFFSISQLSGLSLLGGVVGIFFSYIFLTKRRKIHAGRFLDYVSVALLSAFPVGYLGMFLIQIKRNPLELVYLAVVYFVMFLFFARILFPRFHRGNMKVGSMSLLFLIMFSLVSLLKDIILLYKNGILLQTEDFFLIGLFFISAIVLVRVELKKATK